MSKNEKNSPPKRVSVWVGEGRWISIPVGTPGRPLTDEELQEARFLLDVEAQERETAA